MKLTKLPILLGAVLLGGFTACNDIEQADRYEPIEVTAKKNVLIEDFTGQHCVNCPKAADEIQRMQADSTIGEHVIAVSIHGGSMSKHDSETSGLGLATDEGETYNSRWNVKSWPKGLVDRTGGLQDYESWNASVVSRLAETPKVNITADKVAYDEETRTLKLVTSVSGNADVTGELHVWLTESSVTAPQILPFGVTDPNYVHNHVYRAAINGVDGEVLTLESGKSQKKEYTYTFARNYWNAQHAAVVIFFSNSADGVMQVIDAPLFKNGQPVDKDLKSIALDKQSLSLFEGGSETLSCIFTPSDATNKQVSWTSSDTTVATVSAEGVVTGVKAGQATIVATALADPSIQASCAVTVEKKESDNPVQVIFNGKRVHDGDVLEIPMHVIDYGGGMLDLEFGDASHGSDPKFVNTDKENIFGYPVSVKVTLAGDKLQPWSICGLGYNACITMTQMSALCNFNVGPGKSVSSQIHYGGFSIEKKNYGTADIICEANVNGEELKYTLRYVYQPE